MHAHCTARSIHPSRVAQIPLPRKGPLVPVPPGKQLGSLTQQKWKEGVALENFPFSKDTHPYWMRACEADPEPKAMRTHMDPAPFGLLRITTL